MGSHKDEIYIPKYIMYQTTIIRKVKGDKGIQSKIQEDKFYLPYVTKSSPWCTKLIFTSIPCCTHNFGCVAWYRSSAIALTSATNKARYSIVGR
jgi:hypothetical protein